MKDNPTETIILEVANETDNASTDCQLLYDYFYDLAFAEDSIVWWGDHVPTLGEARGKVVLFMNMKGTDQYPQSVYQNGSYYWAVAVSWKDGDADHKRAEYAFSYNGVDVWSQNKWQDLDPDEKAQYVKNTIYHPEGGTSFAEDTVAENAAKGKKTWFVSYASANTPPWNPPSSYADVVNDLIANEIAYGGSDAFCGIHIALAKETAEGTTAISKTDTPVLFAIEVPPALWADGRSYVLVRSHEGEAAAVSKGSSDVLNAESDEFSAYVIAYDDNPPDPDVPSGDNPPGPIVPTGDSVPHTLLVAFALLAIASIGIMLFAFKRRTDV